MKRMEKLMATFRTDPPKSLGGLDIISVRDYSVLERKMADGSVEKIEGPVGNLLIFETSVEGNYVAARPSGTEPKVKFYMFTYLPSGKITDLETDKKKLQERLDAYAQDMHAFADSIT